MRTPDEVALAQVEGSIWAVDYRLSNPAKALVFARTDDDSRRQRWRSESVAIELARASGFDFMRSDTSGAFSSARFVFSSTPFPTSDFPPYQRFSDGGMLIYSGRFHACRHHGLVYSVDCKGPWAMSVTAPPGTHIVVNGQVYESEARWLDDRWGSRFYIGPLRPVTRSGVPTVIDSGLPDPITKLLLSKLPDVQAGFSQRLSVDLTPFLFVSYDRSSPVSRISGNTIRNQVFIHFAGRYWDEAVVEGNDAGEILWLLTHELAHVFQLGLEGDEDARWIHEGSAEAFTYLLLQAQFPESHGFWESKRKDASKICAEGLSAGPLATAVGHHRVKEHYACGLLIFLAIDQSLRHQPAHSQTLFDLWLSLVNDAKISLTNSRDFLRALQSRLPADLVSKIGAIIQESKEDPAEALLQLDAMAQNITLLHSQ